MTTAERLNAFLGHRRGTWIVLQRSNGVLGLEGYTNVVGHQVNHGPIAGRLCRSDKVCRGSRFWVHASSDTFLGARVHMDRRYDDPT